ncbi:unnamed protein product, partial [Prorocentrum cordatum]
GPALGGGAPPVGEHRGRPGGEEDQELVRGGRVAGHGRPGRGLPLLFLGAARGRRLQGSRLREVRRPQL